MNFRKYRKKTVTVARKLSVQDLLELKGLIQTLEGPKSFLVGDYLAKDSKGVWPIRKEKIEQDYRKVSDEDRDGFASYQPLDIREACQMNESFIIGSLTGKAGDYLVKSNSSEWPVDRQIFESSYELVED
jgi:hypothetical protein